jgi:microcystin-dependent protein
MVNPFLGEIKLVGFTFAPAGWALTNGQLLSISQNTALFSLIGTFYGGNGTSNFALPDLRGRAVGGAGVSDFSGGPGQQVGTETVALNISQYPTHSHTFAVNSAAGPLVAPTGHFLASPTNGAQIYVSASGATLQPLNTTGSPPELAPYVGGGAGHENMQPFLAMTYCIAMSGIFPSRN